MNRTEFIQRAAIECWLHGNDNPASRDSAWAMAIRFADAMPAELAEDDDERKFVLQEVYDRLAEEPGDEHIRAMQIVTRMMEWCK